MTTNYMETLWIVLAVVLGFSWLVSLAIGSGRRYTVHDTEFHATEYAGVIREGHGGLTGFLWATFLAIGAWTVWYLMEHWSEFSVLFEP